MKQLSQWRTFWGLLSLGGMMLAALWMCPHEARAGVAITVVGGLAGLGAALAAKAYGEHREKARAAAPTAAP